MISTRLHGAIDYSVAALLGRLSLARSLTGGTRRRLGAASLFHTGYSLATDYEAGVRPWLSMKEHLALDAVAGAGLVLAAFRGRHLPPLERALLVGIGLTELAVVAQSGATAAAGPGSRRGWFGRMLGWDAPGPAVVYAPIDTPKAVAPGVHIVDAPLEGVVGHALAARMTILALPDGGLLLHSPTRYSFALKTEIEKLGKIRHLVAPNPVHWMFVKEWQEACPGAVTWSVPGLRARRAVRRSGLRVDREIRDGAPSEWPGIEIVSVPGGFGYREIALFDQASRTLVLTDLVLNLEIERVPAPLRPLVRAFGSDAPYGMTPPYVRALVRLARGDAARAAERLVALAPARVIFSHGAWFDHDATTKLRHSLRWLLR